VQAVYERLLKYPTDEVVLDPVAYLMRVAWNELNRAENRAQADRQRTVICDPSKLEQYVTDQGAMLWTEDNSKALNDREDINRALRKLPPDMRLALILRKRDGLSYKQIAAKTGVSEHTVKKRLCAAVQRFREHFGELRPVKSQRNPRR
jgi:RNA polymerase sigma factor (sigma-70 family)